MAKSNITILVFAVATFTIAVDAFFHALFTSPFELPRYFIIGFIGAATITYVLSQLKIKRYSAIYGGLAWAAWKGLVYGFLLPLGFKVSVADAPHQIAVLGSVNPTILFFYWLITHFISYYIAYKVVASWAEKTRI